MLFIRAYRVHLVLSDLHMPQLDGIEFARALRQCGWAGVFFFMSGHVAELKKYDLEALKVRRVIEKPFDIVTLGEFVGESLREHYVSA